MQELPPTGTDEGLETFPRLNGRTAAAEAVLEPFILVQPRKAWVRTGNYVLTKVLGSPSDGFYNIIVHRITG
jgi:hypothetical protein